MGVIHKLKPEISEFIILHKNKDSSLSCRKFTALISENFQVKVSKSSINKVIKEAGLSAPVGRTLKKKRQRIPMPALPILLADSPQLPIKQEEEKKRQEELIAAEAEKSAREAKEKARLEEEAKEAEALRIAEEAKLKALEAARKAEEELIAAEAEKSAREAKEKARLEEERKKEEALKKAQEEEARKTEEFKRVEAEAKRAIEEAAEKAEKERWARLAEEERLANEAKEKARLEEERKKEEALKKAQEEEKKRQEELIAAEAEKSAREAKEKARLEEERKKEEALEKVKEEEKKSQGALPGQEEINPAVLSNMDRFTQIENTGIILLKAVDSMIGGSQLIAKAIKDRLGSQESNLNQIVENLIFWPLLQEKLDVSIRNSLVHYLNELENVESMNSDISRIVKFVSQEVRCIKILLSDGGVFYLDGQLHSVWSSGYVPHDFASPINSAKEHLNRYFVQNEPLLLFNAPGYDIPSAEFFNFLSALEATTTNITNVILYGHNLNELEASPATLTKKHSIIFGVWPWQFTACRKVKSIGEFKLTHLEAQNKDIYIASIDMDLQHPGLAKQFSLTGCAVKTNLNEKIKLAILSNLPAGQMGAEELAARYLNHWPNLDEAFQDYSRKIELFTYTGNSQRFFPIEKQGLELGNFSKIEDILNSYLATLDAYLRWYFLPAALEDRGLELLSKEFYSKNVQLTKTGESCLAKFILPAGYTFGKDLGYACRRINENDAVLSGGVKLYLNPD